MNVFYTSSCFYTLRWSTARACRSYIARARDRFAAATGLYPEPVRRGHDWPGCVTQSRVANRKLKSGLLTFALKVLISMYISLPFRSAYKADSMNVPPHGGEVRTTSPHRYSLSFGAERNFF